MYASLYNFPVFLQSFVPSFNNEVHATQAGSEPPNKRDQTMRSFCRQITLVPDNNDEIDVGSRSV